MAAGAALAAKRGKKSKSSLKGPSRQMASSMSESELRKIRTRISATRRRAARFTIKPGTAEGKNVVGDEGFYSLPLSPCIAAIASVKGARLTLLVPVKG
jgi:hypothetical protein